MLFASVILEKQIWRIIVFISLIAQSETSCSWQSALYICHTNKYMYI